MQKEVVEFFGGIDGGATKSTACIIDINGNILSKVEGPSTQLWLIGVEESAKRIRHMFKDCFVKANLSPNSCLKSIGCCISGSEQESICLVFSKALKEVCSDISELFTIKNDTYGPVATVSQQGCIVLISGTGSNCQFISEDNNIRSGGWGHRISERASAYWIAKKAVKIIFDDEDDYKKAPFSTLLIKDKMFKYFNATDRYSMLDAFYGDCEKPLIAGFCKILSELARDHGDELSKMIFTKAGKDLARYIIAVLQIMLKQLKNIETNLKVVCVGSVWKSWDLLKSGFDEMFLNFKCADIISIQLVELTTTSAVGGAILGASLVNGIVCDIDYSKNYVVFHTIKVNK